MRWLVCRQIQTPLIAPALELSRQVRVHKGEMGKNSKADPSKPN